MPSGPGKAENMPYWKYRLHWADGRDAGEAEYVERIRPGDIVWNGAGEKLRVLSVIDGKEDELYTGGLLQVEAASGGG